MSHHLVKGADTSFWHMPVSRDVLAAAKDKFDLEVFTLGLNRNPDAEECLRDARSLKYVTSGYIYTYLEKGNVKNIARSVVDRYKKACGKEWKHMRFVAVDIEDRDSAAADASRYLELCVAMVDYLVELGATPIIYTGQWYWRGHLGDPVFPRDVPVWTSFYPDNFDPVRMRWVAGPFGGWTNETRVGMQYKGTNHDYGFGNDKNIWSREFIYENQGHIKEAVELQVVDMAAEIDLKAPVAKDTSGFLQAQLTAGPGLAGPGPNLIVDQPPPPDPEKVAKAIVEAKPKKRVSKTLSVTIATVIALQVQHHLGVSLDPEIVHGLSAGVAAVYVAFQKWADRNELGDILAVVERLVKNR